MGFTFTSKLPTPVEIQERFPLVPELAKIKHARDEEVKKVFTGKSGESAIIIGPRLAGSRGPVCDCAGYPMKVQEKTKDKLIIIPQVYTSKPRATDEGYTGMIHQPDPEKRPDMSEGILAIRHIHMRVLRETGFSTAGKMFYPEDMNHLPDMMSYVTVGTHSAGDQFHRLVTSDCDIPVDMKDPVNGSLIVMLNSMVAAQLPHGFIFRDFEVQYPDNLLTHTILRGAANKRGQYIPNYHYEGLEFLFDLHNEQGLQSPACIVDTNHTDSSKQCQEQTRIAKEMLHSRRHSGNIRDLTKSLITESYIESGSRKIGEHCYDKSIINPCLGWDDTERLLYKTADNLDQHNNMV